MDVENLLARVKKKAAVVPAAKIQLSQKHLVPESRRDAETQINLLLQLKTAINVLQRLSDGLIGCNSALLQSLQKVRPKSKFGIDVSSD